MSARWPLFVLFASASLSSSALASEPHSEDEDVDRTLVVGLGGAAEVEVADGTLCPGGNIFVEWDAVENGLELELGVSALGAENALQVPVDLLFKKPFRLTRWVEFMVGLGPEIVTTFNGPTKGTRFGGEAALDFMFWPWQRGGFWIEPSCDVVFQDGVSLGIGSTGGIMVGW